ncbi:MAG TPA: hypothetical protein VIT90_17065 [Lysobacter sp.]
MGRPRKDDLVNVRGQLAPPPLDAAMRRLWHREFDRFPAGYFVPADINGMLLYLNTLAEYEAARQRVQHARAAAKREERRELRAITRQLIVLMRALRMLTSTRAHPTTMGRLAHDAAKQAAPATDEPAWRVMMREAGAVKPN